ncbi:pentapeptide repeat-containing protein [uncultured Megasphaera sp.]|uniref:pentapeptide repeat-containing protein n=1 Tax=uncultured Megasphaera sp. TaxID=165188 RepID=UPI00259648D0|nr:pentapeptide repeat-containing protein [uncultured Megasphaera sp.]
MREITQEEIKAKLEAHKLWLDTGGEHGEKVRFTDVLIANKNFTFRNLHGAVFENVECVSTDFERANLFFTRFKNVHFHHVNFTDTRLTYSKFIHCSITDTTYPFADLKNVDFTCTTLDNVNFTYSNLYKVDFSAAIIKNIHVARAIPINIVGQKVICTQVNTSRKNNLISYWADLGIWTTGCFQGTLEELREKVAATHKNNPFLRARYERAIDYILEEDKADKEKRERSGANADHKENKR